MTARAHLLPSLILGLLIWVAAPLVGGPLQNLVGVEAAQAQTVRAIAVSGNNRVDDTVVISFLTVKVGQTANSSNIVSSIDSLYQSGLFKTVDVRMSGNTLRVSVSENPIVASVLFDGNRKINDGKLANLVDLSESGVYTDAGLERGVRAIRAEYDKIGIPATVRSEVQTLTNQRVRVTFHIVEGDRIGVAAINFTGNQSISDWTLRSVIKTRQSHLLSFLFRDDVYDEAKIAADKELIRQFYVDHGFPDAIVQSAVVEFDEQRGAYYVNFDIQEGERYEFGDIAIETSIPGVDTRSLEREIRTREGTRFSGRDLDRTTQEMSLAAANQGYSFAEVRPRVERDIANKRFRVTYLVDEGARLYVERINIFGNDKTRDFVIRRAFDFAEGDPFNRALLMKARDELEGSGLFAAVQVSIEPGSAGDLVVVNVLVEETSTAQYGATAGYSTADGVLGELSLTERNFLGRGQYLKASISATSGTRSFDFSFTEPHFLGLDVSTGFDVYRRTRDENETATTPVTYGMETIGGQVRVGVPLTDELSVNMFAGYEHQTFTDNDPMPAPAYLPGSMEANKIFVGKTLTFSTLDDSRRPTEGVIAQLTTQYVGLDYSLAKVEGKARYFYSVLPDYGVVASIKGQAGTIYDFSGGGVSPLEAYRASARLVRGFVPGDFGPRSGGDTIGITEYAAVSGEVEFPIPVIPESYGIRGAVWADAAYFGTDGFAVAIDGTSNDVPVRTSAGASLIWDSPFGALRGDFAYAINKSTDDKTQTFQLTLSNLF
ncbi:outer membrane protein assembly factor BamA [Cucumibacter marinus]|uniref:outer membrane protein assembly factor BamA n=1 Tax=Cucumibacter marinus TaxID=1121252 RepID=UPI00068748FA|nr:outer membrane protein assembly factor BamA [Cucumibacter marinus]